MSVNDTNVLLVENREACIDALIAILENSSVNITVCRSLEEAEKVLPILHPDVVILDKDVLSPHKAFLKDARIVIFTGRDYLERAAHWIAGNPLVKDVEKIARRKNGAARLQEMLSRMSEQISSAEKKLGETV